MPDNKCPFCTEGTTGQDYFGEAIDCCYCGGSSILTTDKIKEHIDQP